MTTFLFFFLKQKTAYEMLRSLVGSEMCIRDRHYNRLTSLPDSFGDLQVGGHLNLCSNQLQSLPNSFRNLQVGRDLDLSGNKLHRPDSFGDIQVGGDLFT
eukprot:TRINITY_DN58999_c0_g1_i1.p1 TRINITY_DN58999_c0_g1~~TRINITY_DN58999_c0_g1_i1.p1  ORF type:complete len:100 (+),score=33.07 TRINITY_DN58999_c0_g1_i1:108-407(+)